MSLRTALPLLAVIASDGTGHAEVITIDTNTVYDYTNPNCFQCDPQFRVVDGDNPPTVFDVVSPARIDPEMYRSPAVELRGTSILNMSGGYVNSTFETILATSQSTVNVSGGDIDSECGDGISAIDQAQVNISGGVVSGGDDGDPIALRVDDDARASISGGTVVGDFNYPAIKVMGNGHVTISGGIIVNDVIANDASTIDIASGRFAGSVELGYLRASDESTANIYGGDFERARGNPPNADVRYRIEASDQATVNIFGTDFSTEPWTERRSRLRGRLADGHELDVIIRGNVVLHEVPEPSSIVLLIFYFIGFILLRHTSRQMR